MGATLRMPIGEENEWGNEVAVTDQGASFHRDVTDSAGLLLPKSKRAYHIPACQTLR